MAGINCENTHDLPLLWAELFDIYSPLDDEFSHIADRTENTSDYQTIFCPEKAI